MADRFIGMNRGQTRQSITDEAATQAKDVEVRIDTGRAWKKSELVQKLKEIIEYITTKSQHFT